MENSRIRETRSDQIFNFFNYIILGVFLITVLYPLIFILSASFSSPDAVVSGKVWLWPVEPSLEGYKAVFEHDQIWIGFLNSVFYALVGTMINIVLTIMVAYPLARKDFYGRNLFMILFMFTMMFNGGLIPTYLLIKDLGLLDTRWALLLPAALSVWNMIIMRTYFQSNIPHEMLEAAQMDGCNDFKFVWKIVLPLSGPIIAVISLFYAVGHWNQYFSALIYLKDENLYPLQLVLRDILIQNEVDMTMMSDIEEMAKRSGLRELLKFSLIVVSALPLMIVYPFVQKHFVKGVMIGSLKG